MEKSYIYTYPFKANIEGLEHSIWSFIPFFKSNILYSQPKIHLYLASYKSSFKKKKMLLWLVSTNESLLLL